MLDSTDSWFKREILVHEPALRRYLNRIWRQSDEINDLCQEIYVRVYDAALKSRPQLAKPFLFSIARNLLSDRIRRGRIISIEAVGTSDALNVLVDELSPERRLSAWQELRRVTGALNGLPPKCREIVWLRKVNELSTREVAQQLGISERTVESQILKGMRLMTDAIFAKAFSAADDRCSGEPETEKNHERE